MKEWMWIVGGLAIAAGGVGYYIYNRAPAKPGGKSPCETIAGGVAAFYGYELPEGACKDIDNLGARVGTFFQDVMTDDEATDDAANKALNGEVDVPLDPTLKKNAWVPGRAIGSWFPFLSGTVLRFKNGCEPVVGAPGWTKCKPGTHDMVGLQGAGAARGDDASAYGIIGRVATPEEKSATGAIELAKARRAAFMTGGAGDPTTSPATAAGYQKVGGSYWVAGKKVECETGELIAVSPVRDERSGTLVTSILTKCGIPGSQYPSYATPDRGVVPGGDSERSDASPYGSGIQTVYTSIPPGTAPPGYVWDPVCRCYKRKQAGT